MNKPEVELLERSLTIEALPAAAKAQAGVVLSVDDISKSTLQLAKDGHVRTR